MWLFLWIEYKGFVPDPDIICDECTGTYETDTRIDYEHIDFDEYEIVGTGGAYWIYYYLPAEGYDWLINE